VDDAEAWYRSAVANEVGPLLREYWFDNAEQARRQVEELLR
jgi:hypothetical protein